MILVYVTHRSAADAKALVTDLLKRNLIACANTFPTTSHYSWQGKLKEEKEVVTVLKTRESLWSNVQAAVLAQHRYETPCVIRIEAEANPEFTAWLNRETAMAAIGAPVATQQPALPRSAPKGASAPAKTPVRKR